MIQRGAKWLRVRVQSTPARTFVLYPTVVCVSSVLGSSGRPFDLRFAPLLAWGYAQYYFCGEYRQRLHAGSRGMERLPDRLIESGAYALTRNPMYLGHLIFLLGLALLSRSRLAWLLFIVSAPWFHVRVLQDEARLTEQFGDPYRRYCDRVRRWIPLVI